MFTLNTNNSLSRELVVFVRNFRFFLKPSFFKKGSLLLCLTVLVACAGDDETSNNQSPDNPDPTPSSNNETIYSQDFESVSVNTLPEGYKVIYNGLGTAQQRVEESEGNRYLRVAGKSGRVASIRKDFANDFPQKTTISANMKFMKANGNDYLGGIGLKNQAGEAGHLGIARQGSGQLVVVCKGGETSQVSAGKWVRFQMEFDFSAKKVKKSVNSQLLCEESTDQVNFNAQGNSWGQTAGLLFDSFNHSTIVNHFDEVLISQSSNSNSEPKPKPSDKPSPDNSEPKPKPSDKPSSPTPSIDTSRFTWKAKDRHRWAAREEHTSVTFNGKIWVLGGTDGKRTNDVWSSADGVTWTEHKIPSGSTRWSARDNHTSVVFDSKIWVLGGVDENDEYKNDVWSSSDGVSWTQVTNSAGWSVRHSHTSVVKDKKIWVLGGVDENDEYKNDVWSSSDGVSWTKETDSADWSGREDHTSVVFDNKIWVLGGVDGSLKNDVWSSQDGVNWTEHRIPGRTRWSLRYRHTTVVFDKKIWVIGGYSGAYTNGVWSSPDGVNWTEHRIPSDNTRWSGRNDHTTVVFDNKIWVIGGNESSIRLKNDVWSSADGENWQEHKVPAGKNLWAARWNHTSLAFSQKIWVLGGIAGSRTNDVWSSADGKNWQEHKIPAGQTRWARRYNHTSVVFNNKIWVMGGGNGFPYYQNDVWSSADGKNWQEHKIPLGSTRWSAREEHASVTFNGKIWVLGGYDKNDEHKNDVWSSQDGTHWTKATDASWSARKDHASLVFNNRIWVLGGYSTDGGYHKNDVWSSSDGVTWKEHKIPAGQTRWSGREDHASLVFNNRIWVLGGYDGNRRNDVWSSSDGVNWTEHKIPVGQVRWSGRSGHASVMLNNQVWVLGGYVGDGQNDVWAFEP